MSDIRIITLAWIFGGSTAAHFYFGGLSVTISMFLAAIMAIAYHYFIPD